MSTWAGSGGVSTQQRPLPASIQGRSPQADGPPGWGPALDPGQDMVVRTVCLLWVGSPSSGIGATSLPGAGDMKNRLSCTHSLVAGGVTWQVEGRGPRRSVGGVPWSRETT